MKKLFIISAVFISFSCFAQESHGSRTIEYTVELDRLKLESQELNIEKSLKSMEGVKSCDVDALNYLLTISVFEPKENNKSIEIDDIKIVLANNDVEIKNYSQKITLD
jgi:hypothetical protein